MPGDFVEKADVIANNDLWEINVLHDSKRSVE